jgi:hypothetical protein
MAQPLEGEHLPAFMGGMPKRLRLTTARDVRRELHRLYGMLMAGQLDTDTARTGGFLLRTMLESIRTDELETRLTALEQSTIQEDDNE